jgi:hypothetical protein
MNTTYNDNHINKGILSNDNIDLHKLANDVNNKKKKKNIYEKYRKNFNKEIQAFNDLNISSYDKGTYIKPNTISNGFFSAQGDYSEYKPETLGSKVNDLKNLKKIYENKNIKDNDNCKYTTKSITLDTEDIESNLEISSYNSSDKFSDILSNDLSNDLSNNLSDDISDYISDDISDNLSDDMSDNISNNNSGYIYNIEDEVKKKSNYRSNYKDINRKKTTCLDFDLESVDSIESLDSGESLLNHIRYCPKCKKKVIELIKNHKEDIVNKNRKTKYKQDNYDNNNNIIINENSDSTEQNKRNELKEIGLVFLIGFLVIFFLDLFMSC